MKTEKAKQLTEKICAIALEELNGFSRKEANEKAKDTEGHTFWNRINSLLVRTTINPNQKKQPIVKYYESCDGTGSYEGGKSILTTCQKCNGTGIKTA